MANEQDSEPVIGRNTRITVALALGLFVLAIGALTSYQNFQSTVQKEIRDSTLETVVELTKLGVQVEQLGENVKGMREALSYRDDRYQALEERLRALEQRPNNR